MAKFLNPVFYFKTAGDTGIDEVPLNSKVLIVDSDGLGTPKEVVKIAQGTLNSSSTVSDFLADSSLSSEAPEYKGFKTDGSQQLLNSTSYPSANQVNFNSRYLVDCSSITEIPLDAGYLFLDTFVSDSNNIIQMAYAFEDNKTYSRAQISGTWGEWAEIEIRNQSSDVFGTVNLIALGGL